MQYKIDKWSIEQIIKLYNDDKLDLSPGYQRNEIWPVKAKQKLIESIKKRFPIPNFFFYEKADGKYEVVDGQQRTRAILGFFKKLFTDSDKKEYSEAEYPEFLKYELSVTIITKIEQNESVERFYALVNSTGLKLNRPELKKAEYYGTRFLSLLEILATNEKFDSLELFTDAAANRMQDTDFIGELVSQIKNGITDKKKGVDILFESDITQDEYNEIKSRFEKILDIIERLNKLYEIKDTRYRQKNDFYTLFGFINENIQLNHDVFDDFYKILVLIGEDIAPSNEDCEPFKDYAYHCVTQSNSKNARSERLKFFKELFLNTGEKANPTQEKILKFYDMDENGLIKVNGFLVLSIKRLEEISGLKYFD